MDNLQWYFNLISYNFIQGSAIENVVCKMTAILCRLQCVNQYLMGFVSTIHESMYASKAYVFF